MSRVCPETLKFARRLVAREMGEKTHSRNKAPEVFHACEKLRPHFVALMGSSGFQVLLSRSLALASNEVRWLRKVRLDADGSWAGLDEIQHLDPATIFEGGTVLLSELLGLLTAFIGKDLTLRLLREVWPKVSINDSEFGTDDHYENTK
jgi:hypothetical protein